MSFHFFLNKITLQAQHMLQNNTSNVDLTLFIGNVETVFVFLSINRFVLT